MSRLKKIAGLAMNKLMRLPGDTVVVYHGTSAQNIDSIRQNGLTENIDNSYQKNGVNYGSGIWVTTNEQVAREYAIESAKGFMKDNENLNNEDITQYFGYGAIISFEVSKDSLNDEGSASVNNLKSNEPISPDKIKNIKIFDINSGKEWIAIINPKMNKTAYHTNKQTKQWIDDRVKILQKSNPDMSNDMAYGIAWQQFKKKHPNWEPKVSKDNVKSLFASHDISDRDIAILYVDGCFLEAYTHAEAINDYLKKHKNIVIKEKEKRPPLDQQQIDEDENGWFDEDNIDDYQIIKDNVKEMAFAHKVDSEKIIYLETNSIYNMYVFEAATLFKKQYPDYDIYDDDCNKSVGYIKIATLSNAYMAEDAFGEKIQVEIYVNPTGKEISDCMKNKYKAIRGVIDNGVEYCWRGDILHEQIKDVNVDEFRFAYENNSGFLGWTFDAHHKYSLLELCKLIRDNENKLSKYGNLQKEIFICGTTSSHGEEYDMQTYDQVLDYIEKNESKKIARLLKKAEYLHCHNCNFDNGDYMYDNDGNLLSWVPDPKTKKFKELSKGQIYKNPKEYEEKNPEHICPICGKKELDTD